MQLHVHVARHTHRFNSPSLWANIMDPEEGEPSGNAGKPQRDGAVTRYRERAASMNSLGSSFSLGSALGSIFGPDFELEITLAESGDDDDNDDNDDDDDEGSVHLDLQLGDTAATGGAANAAGANALIGRIVATVRDAMMEDPVSRRPSRKGDVPDLSLTASTPRQLADVPNLQAEADGENVGSSFGELRRRLRSFSADEAGGFGDADEFLRAIHVISSGGSGLAMARTTRARGAAAAMGGLQDVGSNTTVSLHGTGAVGDSSVIPVDADSAPILAHDDSDGAQRQPQFASNSAGDAVADASAASTVRSGDAGRGSSASGREMEMGASSTVPGGGGGGAPFSPPLLGAGEPASASASSSSSSSSSAAGGGARTLHIKLRRTQASSAAASSAVSPAMVGGSVAADAASSAPSSSRAPSRAAGAWANVMLLERPSHRSEHGAPGQRRPLHEPLKEPEHLHDAVPWVGPHGGGFISHNHGDFNIHGRAGAVPAAQLGGGGGGPQSPRASHPKQQQPPLPHPRGETPPRAPLLGAARALPRAAGSGPGFNRGTGFNSSVQPQQPRQISDADAVVAIAGAISAAVSRGEMAIPPLRGVDSSAASAGAATSVGLGSGLWGTDARVGGGMKRPRHRHRSDSSASSVLSDAPPGAKFNSGIDLPLPPLPLPLSAGSLGGVQPGKGLVTPASGHRRGGRRRSSSTSTSPRLDIVAAVASIEAVAMELQAETPEPEPAGVEVSVAFNFPRVPWPLMRRFDGSSPVLQLQSPQPPPSSSLDAGAVTTDGNINAAPPLTPSTWGVSTLSPEKLSDLLLDCTNPNPCVDPHDALNTLGLLLEPLPKEPAPATHNAAAAANSKKRKRPATASSSSGALPAAGAAAPVRDSRYVSDAWPPLPPCADPDCCCAASGPLPLPTGESVDLPPLPSVEVEAGAWGDLYEAVEDYVAWAAHTRELLAEEAVARAAAVAAGLPTPSPLQATGLRYYLATPHGQVPLVFPGNADGSGGGGGARAVEFAAAAPRSVPVWVAPAATEALDDPDRETASAALPVRALLRTAAPVVVPLHTALPYSNPVTLHRAAAAAAQHRSGAAAASKAAEGERVAGHPVAARPIVWLSLVPEDTTDAAAAPRRFSIVPIVATPVPPHAAGVQSAATAVAPPVRALRGTLDANVQHDPFSESLTVRYAPALRGTMRALRVEPAAGVLVTAAPPSVDELAARLKERSAALVGEAEALLAAQDGDALPGSGAQALGAAAAAAAAVAAAAAAARKSHKKRVPVPSPPALSSANVPPLQHQLPYPGSQQQPGNKKKKKKAPVALEADATLPSLDATKLKSQRGTSSTGGQFPQDVPQQATTAAVGVARRRTGGGSRLFCLDGVAHHLASRSPSASSGINSNLNNAAASTSTPRSTDGAGDSADSSAAPILPSRALRLSPARPQRPHADSLLLLPPTGGGRRNGPVLTTMLRSSASTSAAAHRRVGGGDAGAPDGPLLATAGHFAGESSASGGGAIPSVLFHGSGSGYIPDLLLDGATAAPPSPSVTFQHHGSAFGEQGAASEDAALLALLLQPPQQDVQQHDPQRSGATHRQSTARGAAVGRTDRAPSFSLGLLGSGGGGAGQLMRRRRQSSYDEVAMHSFNFNLDEVEVSGGGGAGLLGHGGGGGGRRGSDEWGLPAMASGSGWVSQAQQQQQQQRQTGTSYESWGPDAGSASSGVAVASQRDAFTSYLFEDHGAATLTPTATAGSDVVPQLLHRQQQQLQLPARGAAGSAPSSAAAAESGAETHRSVNRGDPALHSGGGASGGAAAGTTGRSKRQRTLLSPALGPQFALSARAAGVATGALDDHWFLTGPGGGEAGAGGGSTSVSRHRLRGNSLAAAHGHNGEDAASGSVAGTGLMNEVDEVRTPRLASTDAASQAQPAATSAHIGERGDVSTAASAAPRRGHRASLPVIGGAVDDDNNDDGNYNQARDVEDGNGSGGVDEDDDDDVAAPAPSPAHGRVRSGGGDRGSRTLRGVVAAAATRAARTSGDGGRRQAGLAGSAVPPVPPSQRGRQSRRTRSAVTAQTAAPNGSPDRNLAAESLAAFSAAQ